MTYLLVFNLVFFVIPVSGASVFGLFVYRFLRSGDPPDPGSPPGGAQAHLPSAGPDDLACSA